MPKMIHPFDWSVNSIRIKMFVNLSLNAISFSDLNAYKLLKVKNKIVLDIGAYNGDTAKLFLYLGAKHVICIEKDSNLAKQIRLRNTTVFNESFNLKHLKLNYDVVKMDIEGYEILLLSYLYPLKPMVVEVHNHYLKEQFLKKGFNIIGTVDEMTGLCLMKNFGDFP